MPANRLATSHSGLLPKYSTHTVAGAKEAMPTMMSDPENLGFLNLPLTSKDSLALPTLSIAHPVLAPLRMSFENLVKGAVTGPMQHVEAEASHVRVLVALKHSLVADELAASRTRSKLDVLMGSVVLIAGQNAPIAVEAVMHRHIAHAVMMRLMVLDGGLMYGPACPPTCLLVTVPGRKIMLTCNRKCVACAPKRNGIRCPFTRNE